ncbi:uncharacterized protein F5Z01DRAFT_314500 [Emericellopsis atlantica]|uniref:Uncharacterized protein n=1 Tax=Emericellopsis atlantica TaxID=2614577 RepID=A0A9P7ZTI3_9HYPO|nr:uncharacterized protein F5Z01DRAFT_314500 [Emericellopsis atlantica]KAG9258024.1 hypothetical protein F5Z01DRAFT_314500 [Emericellopsis atlantica]
MGSATLADDDAPVGPKATGSSYNSAPSGHGLRRAFTLDEARKRPSFHAPPDDATRSRRRSSNFTDYSLGEARDILNPQAREGEMPASDSSSLATISIAVALLPAIAGALFKDGSAFMTDLMLLALSGVFLHWSVTQPWKWYHTAQEVRVEHEQSAEAAVEDSDADLDASSGGEGPLEDVPEEGDEKGSPSSNDKLPQPVGLTTEQKSALRELYVYETSALLSCFAMPLLAAYLLHALRTQLSRPSEGLVSNYNLTIFCMVSEVRAFSHMFKLVQSRTLHLQRVVQKTPYASAPSATSTRISELMTRLERLETQSSSLQEPEKEDATKTADTWKQEAAMIRQVRNGIQPDLDALNRAVRRYEKKATLLQMQTESRFTAMDGRLENAIALAAAAAKNSATSHRSFVRRTMDTIAALTLFPLNLLLTVLLLPLKAVLFLVNGRKRDREQALQGRYGRQGRSGKAIGPTRYNGDRVPTRVAAKR